MTHGGQRLGAGRPRGAPNKASALREQQIAETGPTPIDAFMKVMRDNLERGDQERRRKKPNWRKLLAFDRLVLEAACKAGPFVHSRISATVPSNKLDENKLTKEELALVEPILRKALV